VSNEVAHYNRNTGEFSAGLTFGDVHQAMDLTFATLNHYNRLILGSTTSGSVTMTPWEAVFRVACIPDDDAWRYVARTPSRRPTIDASEAHPDAPATLRARTRSSQ